MNALLVPHLGHAGLALSIGLGALTDAALEPSKAVMTREDLLQRIKLIGAAGGEGGGGGGGASASSSEDGKAMTDAMRKLLRKVHIVQQCCHDCGRYYYYSLF